MASGAVGWLVGRQEAMADVRRLLDSARDGQGGALLVSGEAGMGKSALLRAALDGQDDCIVAWGTCVEGGGAPGFWPWTQALSALVRELGTGPARELAGEDLHWIATLVPLLGEVEQVEQSGRGRMLLLDAVVSWLQSAARRRPVVVVLDDLQWADESSLLLLDLLVRSPRPAPLAVLGGVRRGAGLPARLVTLLEHADHLPLTSLGREAVGQLARATAGVELSSEEVEDLFRRAGGHPFFTRELARTRVVPGTDEIPPAIRDAVMARVRRLRPSTREVLEAASLCRAPLVLDVLATVTDEKADDVQRAAEESREAGVLRSSGGSYAFTHDLFRETIAEQVDPATRRRWHHALGVALAARYAASGRVRGLGPAEIARHFRAGLEAGSVPDAVRWTLDAAEAEVTSLALAEGARHLRDLRRAVADAGLGLPHGVAADVMLREADVLARDGLTQQARELLDDVRAACLDAGDAERLGQVALAWVGLGSRFATRRDDVLAVLREALEAQGDDGSALQARLTAALAREYSHSVPEERDLAGPLSEEALRLGRATGDGAVLTECLLARHDLLWVPGRADERATLTEELVALAKRGGTDELRAQALLLHANALLEQGRAAFEPALEESLRMLEEQGQLRHRYTLLTRQVCLDLLRGRLDTAEDRIEEAAAVGERLGEPDAANVRMSQVLELVRARARADELVRFADEAVAHWLGAPVHAHAVAAGFTARAGDLVAASRHVEAVRDLGGWQTDRSYLWSVFVPELAHAAVALQDRGLCEELLAELAPMRELCGVNGALVAFAGSHAETAGRLAAALGDRSLARELLTHACVVYERLGAGRLSAASAELASLEAASDNRLRRQGGVWAVTFDGRSVAVRDCKGLHDLAVLLERPGVDVHVLDLVSSPVRDESSEAIIDRTAAEHYRRRLVELAAAREQATAAGDEQRLRSVDDEVDAISAQLGASTSVGGRAREFGNRPSERARKAVAARVRDAVRRIGQADPELGAHLDRHVETGLRCRYTGSQTWRIDRTG